MKLETQVCSLELAKRLKELGVKQESAFGWYDTDLAGPQLVSRKSESPLARKYGDPIAAFTVAELGENLPLHLDNVDWLYVWKSIVDWSVGYGCPDADGFNYRVVLTSATEANARAKMLVYLIENGLLTECAGER
jgi:hypothetical protein